MQLQWAFITQLFVVYNGQMALQLGHHSSAVRETPITVILTP
jgi:hypothetical protein